MPVMVVAKNQIQLIFFMEGKNLGTAPTVSDSPLVYT
jgi:hypothetical protein